MSKEAGERIQVESQRSISSSKSIKTSKHVSFSNRYQQVSSASALLGDVQEETVSYCYFCKNQATNQEIVIQQKRKVYRIDGK